VVWGEKETVLFIAASLRTGSVRLKERISGEDITDQALKWLRSSVALARFPTWCMHHAKPKRKKKRKEKTVEFKSHKSVACVCVLSLSWQDPIGWVFFRKELDCQEMPHL
jgi:hypothetical protein